MQKFLMPTDSMQFAKALVKQKTLTKYQAEQILIGKANSLVLGNYVILEQIGQGGMGQVLKAKHRRMDRTVALKILSPKVTKSPDAVQRFQREVKAAAKLEHPNIVTAHDADEANGTHFLVMQYVDGHDLSSIIRSHGRMTVLRAVHCLDQAARGLQNAHERGIVHRDIKPANLLLSHDDHLKILDLGLATMADNDGVVDHGLTGTGAIMGTVDFMALEQGVNTKRADARSDIYSLGCTFYYLLTGHVPFSGETAVEKILAHRDQPIPDLGKERPDLPAALLQMFQRMVAKDPAGRYQTMGEVQAALRVVSGTASTVTHPTGGSVPFDPALQKFFDTQSGMNVDKRSLAVTVKQPDIQIPPVDTLNSASVHTDSMIKRRQTRTKTVQATAGGKPPGVRRRRLMAAGGGLVGLLLCGIIIITITNKDGKKTTIRVPEGVETNVQIAPGSNVEIVQQDDTPASPASTPKTDGWPADAPPQAIAPFSAEQAKKHQEAWAEYLKVDVEYTNSIGMKFRLIPPGEFTMGSTTEEIEEAILGITDGDTKENIKTEAPQHKVILTQPIYLGVHEVTQANYEKVMGKNPSYFAATGEGKEVVAEMDTTNHPVEMASWNDAIDFSTKLNWQEKLKPSYFRSGETVTQIGDMGYRLPSEAEWEYACRSGTTTKYWNGDGETALRQTCWWFGNSDGHTHEVGGLDANSFGLHDVHGNVWEWVQDGWNPRFYQLRQEIPAENPHSPFDSEHILRGGNWSYDPMRCRASDRHPYGPDGSQNTIGFRLALSVNAIRQAW